MTEQGEKARLDALRQLRLLDTAPTEAFDRITRIAAKAFGLPMAAISFTDADRQWFKSRLGIDPVSIPREAALCAAATESEQRLVVPDLRADHRFRDSALSREGIRFYAGAPLVTREGYVLGTICVLGREPRQLTEAEIAILDDLAALVISQIELQHAFGRTDAASGLPNRMLFAEDLTDLARNHPGERRYAVLVDLANSEQLNSAIRAAGPSYLDDMIREAAREIQAIIGPGRRVYQVGSTQFALLSLPGMEEDSYVTLLTKMLKAVRDKAVSRFVTTTAVGVVGFALGETQPADLLRMAYSAAQEARSSETRVTLYSPAQDARHHRQFLLLNEFGAALESKDQLSLVYQPRIDLASGHCAGVEALMRWTHPALGEILPAEFIPVIEQTSLARAATAFVLDTALKQLVAWRAAGLADLLLSVNISPANLLEPGFAERIMRSLDQHGLPLGNLELEVTEGIFVADAEQALATLRALTAAGVRLAIDDFGTGYSSLSYLQRLPAQVVKIDQSFIRGLAADPGKQAIVQAMVSLAHNLNYRVVAEGVETEDILGFIISTGCEEAQGFLLSPPIPTDGVAGWVHDRANQRPSHAVPAPLTGGAGHRNRAM